MSLTQKIESILFASHQPVSAVQLQKLTESTKKEVLDVLGALAQEYALSQKKGVVLQHIGEKYQLATHPDCAEMVSSFIKSDITGELTEPALETLTIIAYRGPLTKPEIEHIRGINCSLILRNLLIRGLIEKTEDRKIGMPNYQVTHDFIQFLKVASVVELPDYEKLSSHETLDQVLQSEVENT